MKGIINVSIPNYFPPQQQQQSNIEWKCCNLFRIEAFVYQYMGADELQHRRFPLPRTHYIPCATNRIVSDEKTTNDCGPNPRWYTTISAASFDAAIMRTFNFVTTVWIPHSSSNVITYIGIYTNKGNTQTQTILQNNKKIFMIQQALNFHFGALVGSYIILFLLI